MLCTEVVVHCGCHSLKKEWLCQAVQAAYQSIGREPKDIPKNQFGAGLLPCTSYCKSKVQIVESELQQRKPKALETKGDSENTTSVKKRRKRREHAQEMKQISVLQKIMAAVWRFFLIVTLIVVVILVAYFGYKGLFILSDWMKRLKGVDKQEDIPASNVPWSLYLAARWREVSSIPKKFSVLCLLISCIAEPPMMEGSIAKASLL